MPKEIPLTQGRVAIVDDQDFERLNQWKWYARRAPSRFASTFYATRNSRVEGGTRHSIQMHRVILGVGPGVEIDHIDGDGLNNTRSNLRIALKKENRRNSRKQAKPVASSKLKGVDWHEKSFAFRARIKVDGKLIHLGYFGSEEAAARAYDEAAEEHFGPFARVNFPEPAQSDAAPESPTQTA